MKMGTFRLRLKEPWQWDLLNSGCVSYRTWWKCQHFEVATRLDKLEELLYMEQSQTHLQLEIASLFNLIFGCFSSCALSSSFSGTGKNLWRRKDALFIYGITWECCTAKNTRSFFQWSQEATRALAFLHLCLLGTALCLATQRIDKASCFHC